jgi:hypothetical protein
MARNSNGIGGFISDLKKQRANIEKLKQQIIDRTKKGLGKEADAVIKYTNRKYTPKDKGTLADSGKRSEVEYDGKTFTVAIGYGAEGSGAEAYAVAVHEHPSGYDPPSWQGTDVHFTGEPNRGPKYLERGLNDKMDGMMERVMERVMK